MLLVETCQLPVQALLTHYRESGAYTDCYYTDIAGQVSHAAYVEAFYTTALFKTERCILRWAVARPSTDEEAAQLAAGSLNHFAAWEVEGRGENQLLLCDFQGRTRSWLMTAALQAGAGTRLYFGSAVVPVQNRRTGRHEMGLAFRALQGFHKLYSVALLYSARRRLQGR